MTVTLNIENDAELRAYIKDCIKGQVLSIVREDFLEIIKEEIQRKIKGGNEQWFDFMLKGSLKMAVKELLMTEHSVATWNIDHIKPITEEYLKQIFKDRDWKKIVNDLAFQKIRKLAEG